MGAMAPKRLGINIHLVLVGRISRIPGISFFLRCDSALGPGVLYTWIDGKSLRRYKEFAVLEEIFLLRGLDWVSWSPQILLN